jgi:hypothetical protein
MRVVRSLPETWTDAAVEIVVLDLANHDTTPSEIAAQARKLFPQVRLLAFGPHVHVATLQAAEEAGFDQVLTRGEFSRDPYRHLESLLL